MQRRRNPDVLIETVPLAGKHVVDVGCGDGSMTRLMARQGAHALGVECGARQLAKARAAQPVADERIVEGVAQALPAEDGSVDLVVFFNSLHHVPTDATGQALAEAARVLKPGGLLYVSEPVAEGSHFELVRMVDDETEVRAHAHAALKAAGRFGLAEEREFFYLHEVRYKSFEGVRDRVVSANAEREARFAALDAELRRLYAQLGRPDGDEMCFDQPMRVNLLRKG